MYETFEHTADVGLRIRRGDLNGLFVEAAEGLFSVIVANPEAIRPLDSFDFQIKADRLDELLHDWLDELLFTFHTRHVLLCRFDVTLGGTAMTATARGEPINPARHEIDQEVKAVTYHALKVESEAGVWLAEVILDI
jgi:SHS2 domain-containing protein